MTTNTVPMGDISIVDWRRRVLQYVTWAIFALAISGVIAWALRHRSGFAGLIGAAGCFAAAGLGLWGAGNCLLLRQFETRRLLWNVPHASMSIGLDSLTALFLLPLFVVGAMAALSALRRLPGDYAANRPYEHWLFLNFTLAGAALALVSRNAVLFLFAWELMTVASFLLVENDQRDSGQRGGWVYLTAGHIGAACLFALFALLGAGSGVLDFGALRAAGGILSAAFILAFVGFGGKIGLSPFHSWYPESYPQSPAHVGAILSGVVGNLGVYGLLRFLLLMGGDGRPPAWWGYVLLFAGLASGVIGAARSLASHDLSRLLAWSSVENYGLMATGIGLALLGASAGNDMVAYLGFTAAIFHMLNHSLSKSLLFLSAGSVYARTGTRALDHMGGLMKRLPLTGVLFLIGGLGAASVPPLNGFASELLLLMSAYTGATGYQPDTLAAASMFVAVVGVAVIGGLAVASYLCAFGFVFLGNPRGVGPASRSAERRNLLLPHTILAALALAVAALSPRVLTVVSPTAETLTKLWRDSGAVSNPLDTMMADRTGDTLSAAFVGCSLLAGCLVLAYVLRRLLVRGKARVAGPTWDCGYAAPDSRMQYTSTSFVRPLAENFQTLVNIEDRESAPEGLFPARASFSSSTLGVEKSRGFSHLFKTVARVAARIRVLQAGRVQIYLLYMAVVLVILLLWKL